MTTAKAANRIGNHIHLLDRHAIHSLVEGFKIGFNLSVLQVVVFGIALIQELQDGFAGIQIRRLLLNTALKKRLTEFAGKYPSECRLIDDDGNGCLTFEVSKGRFGFKLTAPYDENRRKAASELAKKNTERLRRQEQ